MHLLSIATEQFRNLHSARIEVSPNVNVLEGDNGHGKTNMLEAVQMFRFGRSFRTHRDTDLIRFGAQFCRVEAEAAMDGGRRETFALSIDEGGNKRIRAGGKDVAKLSELVGRYPCILFGPQDLRIVNGFPAERRRFVDMAGSMANREYLDALRSYGRVLAQRNAALKARCELEELRAWNGELVSRGTALSHARSGVAEELRREMRAFAAELSGAGDIDMEYAGEIGEAGEFLERLQAAEREERRRGATLVGPHKDDVDLRIDGTDVRRFGSQGQKRLCAVVLRLAEMRFIEGRRNERCMLLLDDVFSELDAGNGARLMTLLSGPHQVFITSPARIRWEHPGAISTFRVESGRIEVQLFDKKQVASEQKRQKGKKTL
ncbi:MAG: DNA replication/repair protein RecF [Chitinivibrionia bacterium]|nr:DNA replication/repair protein RecF [Chitinivibrionia bacterium]